MLFINNDQGRKVCSTSTHNVSIDCHLYIITKTLATSREANLPPSIVASNCSSMSSLNTIEARYGSTIVGSTVPRHMITSQNHGPGRWRAVAAPISAGISRLSVGSNDIVTYP
eukprot:SAG11_NODE_2084_length_3847_cov_2.877801_1_plen_113_part_00